MKLKHLFENEMLEITDPYTAYEYARTQRKRIPELEHIIMKSPMWAYEYARKIIRGRWPEAEPVIMQDFGWANAYLFENPEARNPSKDVPLVLGEYAIMDVPNTITDEQVLKVLTLLGLKLSLRDIKYSRLYLEPLIIQRLKDKTLMKINVKQIDGHLDDLCNNQSDFS